jgi:hypothetical protein
VSENFVDLGRQYVAHDCLRRKQTPNRNLSSGKNVPVADLVIIWWGVVVVSNLMEIWIETMNRERLKDLIEGVGIAAIVASLVFVGIETQNSTDQTRLNTQALEIAAYQELMNNISETNSLSIQSRGAAEISAKIYGQVDVESWQTQAALFTLFRHGDMAYFMFERGVISEDRLLSALRPLPRQTDVGLEFWQTRKVVFVKGYQEYIDSLTEAGYWGDLKGFLPTDK